MLSKFFVLGFLIASFFSSAQEMPADIKEVINWSVKVEYASCDEAIIVFTVDQKDGWHVYTQIQPEGGVSFPTYFEFKKSGNYELVGKVKEYGTELHEGQFPERIFPGKKAIFKQKIKIKAKSNFTLNVNYGYMACKEACFPPTDDAFAISVKGCKAVKSVYNENVAAEVTNIIPVNLNEDNIDSTLYLLNGSCEGFYYTDKFKPASVKLFRPTRTDLLNYTLSMVIEVDSIFGMYAFNNPTTLKSRLTLNEDFDYNLNGALEITTNKIITNEDNDTIGYKYKVQINQSISFKDTSKIKNIKGVLSINLYGCENNFSNASDIDLFFELDQAIDNGTRSSNKSLWLIFGLAFLGGLLALLTPCVFPMIPMTVTFFTKQSKTKSEGIRKAIFYSLSIIGIYVLLGVLVSSIFGETALNEMATHPWVNILFFVLFVIFAISFLGAFEISLPTSWVNKSDKRADKGGLIGIFFMAFTLALVSFSCTGPIVGSVLVQSAQGGLIGPIIAMLGFSLALALPFGLFAAFPGWLNSMPQSGGWLNTVKVTLGFLELAFALKFLSNADLVKQWHLLERETFLALWIAIFLMLFIYLIGKIKLPHDSPMDKLSVGRTIFAMIVLYFIIYLIPGMWGAPLKMIAGFPPPATYAESPYGIHGETPEIESDMPSSAHAHGHGITTIRDYYEALEYAKRVNKPLLIDFTGWACVNCRLMEANVWAQDEVAPIMANEFVIASLYVDDREVLTDDNLGKPMINGNKMKTIGDRWMDLSIRKYKEVTQPLYVIVDHNENNISGKATYSTHSDPKVFKDWLEFSLKQFKSTKDIVLFEPDFVLID